MIYQRSFLETQIHGNLLETGRVKYVDNLRTPSRYLVINLLIILVFGAALSFVFDGLANWTALQWFLITAGFLLFEQSFIRCCLPQKYIVTTLGIWILRGPARLFIRFNQIEEIRQVSDYRPPIGQGRMFYQVIYPSALQLNLKDLEGFFIFSKQLTLTPSNLEEFQNAFAQVRLPFPEVGS